MEIPIELNCNYLIIGARNTGKTTLLKKIIAKAFDSNYSILLFDSATEHTEKSILYYCKSIYSDYILINSPSKKLIYSKPINVKRMYPFNIIKDNKDKSLYLFDVSKYLEEGYLFSNPKERENCRHYYKLLVNQILTVMLYFTNDKKFIIIMDEIDFLPILINTIKLFNSKNIFAINTFHQIDECNSDDLLQFNQIKLCIPCN